MTAAFTLPLRVVSEANQRQHWAAKAKRVKAQRQAVAYAWYNARLPTLDKPTSVRIVRLAPRSLDDDNLAGGCKAIRDEIAHQCGFDDRDPDVRWLYAQEKAKTYGVRCEVVWP